MVFSSLLFPSHDNILKAAFHVLLSVTPWPTVTRFKSLFKYHLCEAFPNFLFKIATLHHHPRSFFLLPYLYFCVVVIIFWYYVLLNWFLSILLFLTEHKFNESSTFCFVCLSLCLLFPLLSRIAPAT